VTRATSPPGEDKAAFAARLRAGVAGGVAAKLSNIGLVTVRKRTITGAGSVLTKNRMENTAGSRVEALRAEVAELEQEVGGPDGIDVERLQPRALVPGRTDVKVLGYDLVWVY